MAPPLRQRRVVNAIVRLREQAGLKQHQAADTVGWDHSKLSRAEAMKRRLSAADVYHLCRVAYGADEEMARALAEIAAQSHKRGWWQSYAPEHIGALADLLELEDDTRLAQVYCTAVLPGLVQTAEYATAVIAPGFPGDDDNTLQGRVKLRLARQERLHNRQLDLWCVLDEVALRRPVGDPTVMASQLDHLAILANRPGVTIQVMPLDRGHHPTLGTAFQLLTLKGAEDTPYVYMDNLTGGTWVEEPLVVTRYREAWSRLTASALDFQASLEMVREAAEQHRRDNKT